MQSRGADRHDHAARPTVARPLVYAEVALSVDRDGHRFANTTGVGAGVTGLPTAGVRLLLNAYRSTILGVAMRVDARYTMQRGARLDCCFPCDALEGRRGVQGSSRAGWPRYAYGLTELAEASFPPPARR